MTGNVVEFKRPAERLADALECAVKPGEYLALVEKLRMVMDEQILTLEELHATARPMLDHYHLSGRVSWATWRKACDILEERHGTAAVPADRY